MTEELKQKAIGFIRKEKGLTILWTDKEIMSEYGEQIDMYIAGAEPREKRIAELKKQIENLEEVSLALHKMNVKRLKLQEQIEKVKKLIPKTCDVCVGWGCHARCVDCDFKDKWKLAE